jgi:hypothetical protein
MEHSADGSLDDYKSGYEGFGEIEMGYVQGAGDVAAEFAQYGLVEDGPATVAEDVYESPLIAHEQYASRLYQDHGLCPTPSRQEVELVATPLINDGMAGAHTVFEMLMGRAVQVREMTSERQGLMAVLLSDATPAEKLSALWAEKNKK